MYDGTIDQFIIPFHKRTHLSMNRKRFLLAITMSLGMIPALLSAQPAADPDGDVVIGNDQVDPSAILDLVANDKGMLVPRMTTAERDAIVAPAEGLLMYNTDDNTFYVWSSATGVAQWDAVITDGNNLAWLTTGNNALNDGLDNFLGTTDGTPIRFITSGAEQMQIDAAGRVGINTTTPTSNLHVVGDPFGTPAATITAGAFAKGLLVQAGPFDTAVVIDGTTFGSALSITNTVFGDAINIGPVTFGNAINIAAPVSGNAINAAGPVVLNGSLDQTGNVNITGTTTATGNVNITGTTTATGNVNITGTTTSTGDILPGATNTYNLGSSTQRWNEIFVNGVSSIHLGADGDEAHIMYNDAADVFGIDFDGNGTFEFSINDAGTIVANDIQASGMIPVGGIIMWSGTTGNIPADWALCDGSNGTPDLRGKFVLGAGTVAAHSSGNGTTTNGVFTSSVDGAHNHQPGPTLLSGGGFVATANITIPIPDIPSVTIFGGIDLGLLGSIPPLVVPGVVIPDPTIPLPGAPNTTTDGAHSHTTGVSYYALAYIMRVQ